jgi:parallel beta-helix repeat protein
MTDNGIYILGGSIVHWNTHTITTSNTVNGKPVYYWKDVNGGTVPVGAGQVILAGCTNVVVENQDINGGTVGILLGFSSDNRIQNNIASNAYIGIYLYYSSNSNTISGNTVSGNSNGIYLNDHSNSNTISGNTVSNNIINGIYVYWSSNSNTISGNTVSGYWNGIHLLLSDSNTIIGNTVSGNINGIYLDSSSHSVLINNVMTDNGIYIHGFSLVDWNTHTITTSNTVYGKPVYYWKGVNGGTVPVGAGQVILVGCTNVVVENQDVTGGSIGILLGFSSDNRIQNNIASNAYYGIYLFLSSGNTISGNTVFDNSYNGIYLYYYSSSNTLSGNTVSGNRNGISLASSHSNTISGNTVSGNDVGISLSSSSDSTLINNVMTDNGIYISGYSLVNWNTHTITTSNTVNGKPVYYWKDVNGGIVPAGAGQVILVSCTNIVVENQDVSSASVGILLGFSSDNRIQNNIASNAYIGIYLYSSIGNTISGNTVSGNDFGIYLSSSSDSNTISGNTVSGNSEYGIYLVNSDSNTLSGNTVSGNDVVGIYLLASSDSNTMSGNTVSGNSEYGIYLYSSNSNTISGNTVSGNMYGITLYRSYDNSIFLNNIIDNTNQLYNTSSTNTWDNGAGEGNYWSDYVGLDDGSNGRTAGDDIGDTDLLHQDVDYYPLMNPVPVYTPVGVSIPINPHADISMVFDEVTISGTTTVTSSSSNPGAGLSNFKFLGTYYDISTTAIFNNDITICISYDDTGIPAGKEAKLKIFHWDGTVWVDATIFLDTTNNIICAKVSSLSWFALAYLNYPPVINLISGPTDPVPVGSSFEILGDFTDLDVDDTHTSTWTWGDGSSTEGTVDQVDDTVSGSHYYDTPGVYTVTLTITDESGESAEHDYQYVVVYDPTGGFVTGGGWIDSPEGAYVPDPTLSGKANFGFVAKYKNGQTTPMGNTEFQFKAGGMNFHSDSYEWLVIAGAKAQFKGEGAINGVAGYKFKIWATDGELAGGQGVDGFRIKIWEEDESGVETVFYDNKVETELGGGQIVIHKG